jgi:two-component system cell cycle sensor histidine kinase/response regulator CckA
LLDKSFRLLAEHSLDLVCSSDVDGRILYASPSAVATRGCVPEVNFETAHPDDLARCREWWARIVAGGDERITARFGDASGEWRWFEIRGALIYDEGEPRVLTSCRDVTAHVEALRTVRESEAKLSEAERIAHVGYWENDIPADRITWSEETCRILGFDPTGVAPTRSTMLDRIHPDDRQLHIEATERAKRGEARYDVVLRVVRPDGTVRTIHAVGDVVRDEAGRPVRSFGVVQDITDRMRAAEERALFRHLVDHTSDGIEVIDPATGRFLDVNEQTCVRLGYTRAELLQLRVVDIVPSMDEQSWPVSREATERQGTRTFESRHRRKDGTIFPVEVSTTYVRRDREYIVAIVRDITERKRLEEQLWHAQKMEAVGRLASGVAHDFNNLLTVINGNTDLVASELGPDHEMHEPLAEVREAGERGAALTQQLLAFSRKQVLEPRVVDVDVLVRRLHHLLSRVIGTDVEVRIVSSSKPTRVLVDPARLEHALINLAVNARDAMLDGGVLTIETRSEGESVLLLVSDTGHGMDEATRERVFEPFFTTKEPGRGTGLGLAMVHGFVEQSGGRIDVTSEPGRGTTFTISLPRTATTTHDDRAKPFDNAVGTETVLLAEDEDAVRNLTKRALQSRGYTVLDARDGPDAVSVSRSHAAAIDILVTDIVMPHMNGRDLARVLVSERPDMRVLLMSGFSEDPDVLAEVAAPFLQKPFGANDVARKVRAVLDAAPRR